MYIGTIVERLRDACDGLRQVLPALEGAQPGGYPSAYVLPLAERALGEDGGELLDAHAQRIEARFAVELMVKHAAQAASGGPAQEALEALRDEVKAALAGWQPAPEFAPVAFSAGRLVDFAGGLAVWRDEFVTTHYLEES